MRHWRLVAAFFALWVAVWVTVVLVVEGNEPDPRFSSCAEAEASGYGSYHSGVDQEYGWYEDADGDGVVCEGRR